MMKLTLENLKKLNKKQKLFVTVLLVVLFLDLILCIYLFAVKNHSSLKITSVISSGKQSLYALDRNAERSCIKETEFANFRFNQNQKKLFLQVFEQEGTAALTIRVNLCPTEKQINKITSNDVFKFGFLYSEDFKGKKLKNEKYSFIDKIVIQAKEDDFKGLLDISFALSKTDLKDKKIPEGFYIYSDQKCKILEACIAPAVIGFDYSKEVPFYGFAYNGGKIDFSNASFDFSGAQMVMPSENSDTAQLPQFVINFSDKKEYKSTKDEIKKLEVIIGGEKYFINNVDKADEIIIPCGGVKSPFSRMELKTNKEYADSMLMIYVPNNNEKGEILVPIKTDPGLVINYKQSAWRDIDYEVFQWDRYPDVLIFDTRDYKVQDRFFCRLAYFVEKEGYKGRLLSNEELEGKHGYNAHDYNSDALARFFNKAEELNFELNKEEILLKKILIKNGIFEYNENNSLGNRIIPKLGEIASISRECPDWNRSRLLAHEGWHTVFFRDEEFRNFVSAVYYTFDSKSRDFLIAYFKSQPQLGYDVNDDYLMHTEFMSYIMQQRVSQVGPYFVHCAERGTVMKYTPELSAYIRDSKGQGFEDAAIALNDFVFDKYGIVCGNIGLINR